MSREVRRVPLNWKHPIDERGKPIPMFDRSFEKEAAEWDAGQKLWLEGNHPDQAKSSEAKNCTWEEWHGSRPDPAQHFPEFKEPRDGWCMYETTSEGTPMSPIFKTPEELARWLADNKASAFGSMTANYEEWLATINAGSVVSAVLVPGVGLMSGVAAARSEEKKKSLSEFKTFLIKLLTKFDGFDPSAISEREFNVLYRAYESGISIDEVASAVVDGSAYDRFFGEDEK